MTAECDLLSDENDKVKLQITDPSASTSLSVSWVKKLSNNADSIWVGRRSIFWSAWKTSIKLSIKDSHLLACHYKSSRKSFLISIVQHNFMATVKSHEIVLLLFDISNEKTFDWACKRASVIASTKKSPTSVVLIGRVRQSLLFLL